MVVLKYNSEKLLWTQSKVFFNYFNYCLFRESCLIWQIISSIFPPNEYGYLYAWITLRTIATDRFTEDADFGRKIIFSDEAHFDLGEYVNKQNCRIWDTENPHAYTGADFGPEA